MTETKSSTPPTSGSPTPAPPKGKPPSKFWLYLPFVLFALVCAAYTAYWFFAKGKIDEGLNSFIAQQEAAGTEINYTSKRLHGFPFRFALTVEDLKFANEDAGFDWQAEKFQVNMQPWNFYHAIIRSSGRNEVALADGQNYTAQIGKKSALSLHWNNDGINEGGLTLDQADIVGAFGDIGIDNLRANIVNSGQGLPGKRISIDWDGISLAEEILAGTDAAFLGTELQASRLRLQGQGFGVFGEADARKVEIAQLLFNWGPVKLGSKGKFDIADAGHLDGTLNLRLDDADALGEILRDNNLLNSETALVYGPLSIASEDGGFFPLPLRNGFITMLGQELAPVPPIAPPLNAPSPLPPPAE